MVYMVYCAGRRHSTKYSLLFIYIFLVIFHFHYSFEYFEMRIHTKLCSIDWFEIVNGLASMSYEQLHSFYDWFLHFYCQKFNFTGKYLYATKTERIKTWILQILNHTQTVNLLQLQCHCVIAMLCCAMHYIE